MYEFYDHNNSSKLDHIKAQPRFSHLGLTTIYLHLR